MSRSLSRFKYHVMKQQDDPYIKEFLCLVENQFTTSEFIFPSLEDLLNVKQKRLFHTYNRAAWLDIYYFTLHTYLKNHKELCVKGLCDINVSMAYTSKELELLYRKHLQYKETSEYIYHILYNNK